MKILNKKFYHLMVKFNEENNLYFNEYEISCYANLCEVINDLTNQKFDFYEILSIYDFFTDVLDGKEPTIDIFTHHDAFTGFYRLSKRYKPTKKLEEKERLYLCFAIYWASCIQTYNEKTKESEWNLSCFENGADYIIEEYEHMKEISEKQFVIVQYSNYQKEDYGYSVNNPIEVTSVSTEYQYLNALKTIDDEDITYERIGSFSGKNDIFVDSYNIFVNDIKIKTLYITGDGNENSMNAPAGFRLG